jgi:hypothetical protein
MTAGEVMIAADGHDREPADGTRSSALLATRHRSPVAGRTKLVAATITCAAKQVIARADRLWLWLSSNRRCGFCRALSVQRRLIATSSHRRQGATPG